MEEMLDDTLEMDDDEELEEEADEEVDKVLFDLTNGKLGQAGTVQTELPVSVSLLAMLPRRSPRPVCAGASGRGRDRTGARAVSATTQRPTERINALDLLSTRALVSYSLLYTLFYALLVDNAGCNKFSWLLEGDALCTYARGMNDFLRTRVSRSRRQL